MSKSLQLEIVTPDKVVLSEQVDYVGVPGIEGEFGVLADHIPLLSALAVGGLYYKVGGSTQYVFVSGGFAEVSDNKLTVLAESAELAKDIDVARAQEAKARAEKRLAARDEKVDTVRAELALQRSVLRIKLQGAA